MQRIFDFLHVLPVVHRYYKYFIVINAISGLTFISHALEFVTVFCNDKVKF